MTTYTPNYHLPLYEDSDKPNLRDQYNGAINAIDTQFADVATENTTTQNLIANINRDISGLNDGIAKVNDEISALQTLTTNQGNTLSTLTDQVNTIDSEVGVIGVKATQNSQNIATQNGYFVALGVDSVDEAAELKSDIDEAHTQSMANQTDISQIKIAQTQQGNTLATHTNQIRSIEGNVQTLSNEFPKTIAEGWVHQSLNALMTLYNASSIDAFATPGKNAFKIGAYLNVETATLNSSATQIPGGFGDYQWGYPVCDLSGLINPPSDRAIIYNTVCIHSRYQPGVGVRSVDGRSCALGTDGKMYFYPLPTQQATQWTADSVIHSLVFPQSLLSVQDLNTTPVIPPIEDNA